jgi:hypothetical protein
VCARVGNQRSRGVVTARVRSDAVRSLHHQHRDLHQSTYPYLSKERDSSYYQVPHPGREEYKAIVEIFSRPNVITHHKGLAFIATYQDVVADAAW